MKEIQITKLSPKVRAQRLEKKLAQQAKLEAELAALKAQEEEYQAEQIAKAWESLTAKLQTSLKIDEVEEIQLLTEVLTAQEMIDVMKSSIKPDAEEAAEEVTEATTVDTPTNVPSPARRSVSVQSGVDGNEEQDEPEEVSSGFENPFRHQSASSDWRSRYMG